MSVFRNTRGAFVMTLLATGYLAALLACANNPVREADDLIEAGKLDEALAMLQTYYQAHPDDFGVNLHLGKVWLKKAEELEPTLTTAYDPEYQKRLANAMKFYKAAQDKSYSTDRELLIGMIAMKASPED
ncbi:MAG: hypothetical protein HYV63_14725 [Candidatus Schekmanbacteria bacterium]|nr:hypothetical protein [Candidatus Schekmanbacteria bacterium]